MTCHVYKRVVFSQRSAENAYETVAIPAGKPEIAAVRTRRRKFGNMCRFMARGFLKEAFQSIYIHDLSISEIRQEFNSYKAYFLFGKIAA